VTGEEDAVQEGEEECEQVYLLDIFVSSSVRAPEGRRISRIHPIPPSVLPAPSFIDFRNDDQR